MDVIYNKKDEETFDKLVAKLKGMTEQEKQTFMTLLQGFQEGVRSGRRLAAESEDNRGA